MSLGRTTGSPSAARGRTARWLAVLALDALCRGEIEIALVDRAPTARERRVCMRNDVRPRRFQIAHQAVALYPGDRLAARVRCMSVGELRRLWRAGSDAERYSQPLAVDGGSGCVQATAQAVQGGRYEPLSRPLYLLTSRAGLEHQVVRDYVRYVLQRSNLVAGYPGVVPLDDDAAGRQLAQLPSEARGDG